jgi:putative ATPase
MDDLFSPANAGNPGPLADRMRPRTLDEVIGQDHIVGPGRLLRRAIQADRLSSLIFYGPPGTGKTSLARVIANTTRSNFESLNAVLSGVKDIREAIDRSDERRRLYGKRTILFVDEVHRWNKAQQDALLPWVENGTVILIGATTENPFFEVNRALVSRSRIFQLKSLQGEELLETARRTLSDRERGYGKWNVTFEKGALEHLVEVAGGDARSLLNALELAVETSADAWPPAEQTALFISFETAEESIQRRAVLYDRDGDYHFDTISAFIKSIRGSDPDAALYWLAKMVRAGEDPSFIFRRMIILASEDVGLADPHALEVVIACAASFDRIGFPEGNFPLAHACLYLATAPKSNSALAFFDALKEVEKEDAEVPNHLRDASRDAEGFGHGEGYIYPHAYRDHWAAQQYLPTALRGRAFYMPSSIGYEGKISQEVLRKRELQAAIILGEAADGELLSWSPAAKGREGWFKRLQSGRSAVLLADRDAIFDHLKISRHDRVLIPLANDGLLLWEALRRAPEGLAAALTSSQAASEALLGFASNLASNLDETEKPQIAVFPLSETETAPLPSPAQAEQWFDTAVFDHILFREPWKRGFKVSIGNQIPNAFSETAKAAEKLLIPGGNLVILASPPSLGQRISGLLEPSPVVQSLQAAEETFFSGPPAGTLEKMKEAEKYWTWTAESLENALENTGFTVSSQVLSREEERLVGPENLNSWFDPAVSSWGAYMKNALGEKAFAELKTLLAERISQGTIIWRWKSVLVKGIKGNAPS